MPCCVEGGGIVKEGLSGLFLQWGSKDEFDVLTALLPELGPVLEHLVVGVISQRAWSGGVELAISDLVMFGVVMVFSKVCVELVLIVFG